MTPDVAEPDLEIRPESTSKKPGLLRRILGMRFLVISIAVHLAFGLGAAVWVVSNIATERKLTFKGGPPSPNRATRAIEHKVQVARQRNAASAPVGAKRITTTGVSKVALPDMPAMPKLSGAAPTKMAGAGGTGVAPNLGLAGPTAAVAGGSLTTMFGLREVRSGGLAGTFYDLKQTKDGKPNKMALIDQDWKSEKEKPANALYHEQIADFNKAGWNEAQFQNYFKGPDILYNSQFFIPAISADEGPKAFNLAGKVQPRRWVALYKGKVIPPVTGNYTFVGSGDDVLLVRFNGRVVLDGSYSTPTKEPPKKGYFYDGAGEPPPDKNLNRSTIVGSPIEVRAGNSYDIQVLIGEAPGGGFRAWLLLDKEGETYAKDSKGNPVLPIFKLAPSEIPKPKQTSPPFAQDTPWSVWKLDRATSGTGLDSLRKP